ncbi:hypothetical protein QBC40DRAFT_291024, partial [Triangularia verruculosa]
MAWTGYRDETGIYILLFHFLAFLFTLGETFICGGGLFCTYEDMGCWLLMCMIAVCQGRGSLVRRSVFIYPVDRPSLLWLRFHGEAREL